MTLDIAGEKPSIAPYQLLIVVPLYKQPGLIPELFTSLAMIADEIRALNARILLINDSPDFAPLAEALDAHYPALADAVPADLMVNDVNLGFVQSCNFAFRRALADKADVLLLNSDTLLTPGAVTEIARVAALDPLTSVVSPRSNNATICNSPYPDQFRSLGFEDAWQAHLAIQHFLPRTTYVPTAVGFCLYVRRLMLEEFGLFDTVYGGGYNEENDLIQRANQRGYRAVLANHAFVFHIGNISFAQSAVAPSQREAENREILIDRYPSYDRSINRYFTGIEYKAQTLLAGLVPSPAGRLRILFDCRNIGPSHSGTFELAKKMMTAFVKKYRDTYDIFIACSHQALVFHQFDKIIGLSYCWNEERRMAPFAFAFRMAQPFDLEHLYDIVEMAPITGFLMLDTIALDCQQLDDQGLGNIWHTMLDMTATVGFISEFSSDEFKRRFDIQPHCIDFVSLCSTDVADYDGLSVAALKPAAKASADGHILIVGNHFPHKHVRDTLALLDDAGAHPPVCVLGLEVPAQEGIKSYRSGELDQSLVDSLYDEASVVLFPSHYEGFGFPVMHALARGKPIIGRDLPVLREIKERTPFGANLHLYDTTHEMVAAAVAGVAWSGASPSRPAKPVQDWTRAADAVEQAFRASLERFTLEECRRRLLRVESGRARLDAERRLGQSHAASGALASPAALPAAAPARRKTLPWKRLMLGIRQLWKSLGRDPHLRVGESVKVYRPDHFSNVTGRILATDVQEAVAIALLQWADLLILGGVLTLSVETRPGQNNGLSPFTPKGLRIWLINAGLEAETITVGDGFLHASAIKVQDWTAPLPGAGDDAAFLEAIYLATLGRRLDAVGGAHFHAELASGVPRKLILKWLLVSDERAKRVAALHPER